MSSAPPQPWPDGLAQSVLDALPSLTVVIGPNGEVLALNAPWRHFQDTNIGEVTPVLVGDNYLQHLGALSARHRWAAHTLAGIATVLSGRMRSFEMDYDILLGGVDRAFSLTVEPLAGVGAMVSHVDITWRKSLERQLSHRATHDALTGLPNRTLLTERIVQAVQRAARTERLVAVMFADLDQFKVINDTMGHAAGDQVISAVSRRLHDVCRAHDSVTRFGGDEFVIVVEDLSSVDDARTIAERMREAMASPVEVEGVDLWFGTSIGVTLSAGNTRATPRDADNLLRDADTAMYRAKDLGRNRIMLFEPSMRDDVTSRLGLTMALRHAVERGELRLDYQPEFSCRNGSPIGAEALVRWQHPTRGLMSPGEFIEAAEENGLIVDIGNWVLEEACRQAAEWTSLAEPGFTVAINISGQQLADTRFADNVTECLLRHHLKPAQIVLELTESALVRDPSAAAMLERLSDLGVWISVDDFGTGYSSLAYLQRLPVDILKIDRSFISRMAEAPKTTALVHGIVDLAHALGLVTVAEGIETEDQRLAVQRAGCDAYQGFYASGPVAADVISQLLRDRAVDTESLVRAIEHA